MSDLWELTAGELAGAYTSGATHPTDVLSAILKRIDTLNPKLEAVTGIDERAAQWSASRAEPLDHSTRKPLHGIPVAIKELIAVEGMPYTAQSLTRSGLVAERDSAVVAQLRGAGAIVVGTTRTHELAWGMTTQREILGGTRNPWDTAYIPGGSSGGSAAAVASGMVPIAIGTDTACSTRLPAAFCGICGFKPTYGLISTDGVVPLAPSLDHVGILAREVTDIATALAVLSNGKTCALLQRPSRDMRIGVATLLSNDLIGQAQRAVLSLGVRSIDATVVEVEWPHDHGVTEVFRVLQAREALHSHTDVLGTWPEKRALYGTDVRSRLEGAEGVSDGEVEAALANLKGLNDVWNAAFVDADVVLLPASGSGPSLVSDPDAVEVEGKSVSLRDAVIPWQASSSLAGIPACTVPVGLDNEGLPIGLQVIGKRGHDAQVLAVAAMLRNALRSRLPGGPPVETRHTP